MDKLLQIVQYLFSFFAYSYIVIVLLRFLFQMVRADFYNPISQFIVKATNPLLMPLRKIIPGLFGIDVASLILAFVLQVLTIKILLFLSPVIANISIVMLILLSLHSLLGLLLKIYFFSFLIMVIVSWVAPHSHNPVMSLVNSITEPVLRPIRNVIPPMGGLDFSVMFAMLALSVISMIFEVPLL